jgi:excisionase family DNA binding protein
MSDSQTTLPITATVAQFTRLSGIGRSIVYELIADGKLRSVKLGGIRLIIVESYLEYIRRLEAENE